MTQVIDKQQLRAAMRAQRRGFAASLDGATRAALEDQLAERLESIADALEAADRSA